MKIPRIYQALTVSLFFHLSFIAVAIFVISRVSDYRQPLPYVVSLVDDRAPSAPRQAAHRESSSQKAPETPKVVKQSMQPAVSPPSSPKAKAAQQTEQDKLMKERIEALQAKKRIEKLVALRKVIEVDASKTPVAKTSSQNPEKASAQGADASSGRDYYAIVVDKIRQQWVFPGTLDRDLEAVVAIRIARDGRVAVDRVEKSSGNPLFDRSVARAISLASPLPPPPQEMDIGVRFRP